MEERKSLSTVMKGDCFILPGNESFSDLSDGRLNEALYGEMFRGVFCGIKGPPDRAIFLFL